MPTMTKYTPGTPCWVDLSSSDPAASRRFYGSLFGWTGEPDPRPETGGYMRFELGGLDTAGLGPVQPGAPTAWTTYISVEDADAAVARVVAEGGSVMMAPMDVMDVGRMAILVDPVGAVIAVWQPRAHFGAGLVNEANSLCWNELQTRDTARAQPFYEAVFGWRAESPSGYTEWKLGDASIGGMFEMGQEIPAETPPHWAVYFRVDNCAASVARATELGASVLVPPMSIPPGISAVIQDPQGGVFHVLEFAEG